MSMKITFFSGLPSPYFGAGWWRIYSIAKTLKEKGYNVDIISVFSITSFNIKKILLNDGIKIYNIIPILMIENPIFFLVNIIASFIVLFMYFIFIRPSVVIYSIPPHDQLIPFYILSKLFKYKLILDYRDEFEDYLLLNNKMFKNYLRILKKTYTNIYNNLYLIMPVTPYVNQKLKERGIRNTYILYDGVDTLIFKPHIKNKLRMKYGFNNKEIILIYLGYVYEPYRLDILVTALFYLNKKTNTKKYKLLIIGGGEINKLKIFARKLGMLNNIVFYGVIKDRYKIAELINMGDVGIIPYDKKDIWKNTLSTKLFEYAACNLPIIATVSEDSLLAKVIKKYKLGVISPPLDVDELSNAIYNITKTTNKIHKENLSEFARKYDKKILIKKFMLKMNL